MTAITFHRSHVPTVGQFLQCEKFLQGLMGPFGSGKSSGCVIKLVQLAAKQNPGPDGIRRSRWCVVRNTYRQLQDTTIKTVHQWLPYPHFGEWKSTDHTYIIDKLAPDIHMEIMFRALDRPEHVSNLLSLELTGAWVNEAREIPWTIIQALQGRVGRFPKQTDGGATWFGLLLDTNPPDDDSWWYALFEEKRPDNAQLFRQPSGVSEKAENKPNLPKRYYENLLETMDETSAKVYVHGEYGYVQDGKPVYPEYSDATHCSDKAVVLPGRKIYRGWDFGLTPACAFSQLHPSGKWVTFDELTADSLGADRFSDQVLSHCSSDYSGYEFEDYGDPAGNARSQTDERACFEILRGKGIAISDGEQAIAIRLESVKWALRQLVDGKPMLQIHPRCRMLRKGYQGRYRYRRMQVSAERYADEPEKNEYSHIHDGNQYVASRLFAARVRAAGIDPEAPEKVDRYSRRSRRRGNVSPWAA